MITVQEAARQLGVSTMAIYKAIQTGALPAETVLGRIALRADDVAAYKPRAYRERPGTKPKGRPKKQASD